VKAARDLAAAISRRTEEQHKVLARNVELAVIRKVSPLTVELVHANHTLNEGEELLRSHFVKWFHTTFGLTAGDFVLLSRLPNENWVAFDVIDAGEIG
jgi:hypothetical protein